MNQKKQVTAELLQDVKTAFERGNNKDADIKAVQMNEEYGVQVQGLGHYLSAKDLRTILHVKEKYSFKNAFVHWDEDGLIVQIED